MDRFHVGMTADLFDDSGRCTFPDYKAEALARDPEIALSVVPSGGALTAQHLESLDALVALPMGTPIPATVLDQESRLALIVRPGVGFEDVDVEACTRCSVALSVPSDATARPTAVAALTLILALATRLLDKHEVTRRGHAEWARRPDLRGWDLRGRTLGLLGFGRIARDLCLLVKPLGFDVIASDPNMDMAAAAALGVRACDMGTLFSESDIVSIHCPLTSATRRLVDEHRIGLMKRDAFLVNVARGGVVDQQALTVALQERRIAGAGLDVFDPEPPDADDPLLSLDNVVLSAHALNWTTELDRAMAASNLAALDAVRSGMPPRDIVNPDVLNDPRWRAKLAAIAERRNPSRAVTGPGRISPTREYR